MGYHCRRLVRFGTVEVADVEKRRGLEAKFLRPTPLGLCARDRLKSGPAEATTAEVRRVPKGE